ncbi:MAG: M67 family metallopeptidase [Acidimicrobiaceae bacterium]|nr:M67 family metallopeptidase [Acidimicrobiia bacterium]MCY4494554.1 M67 family metallopeptidase [Acidimicrobiaceae bacterium]
MLEIPASVHSRMLGHAIAGLPDEACGLFAGRYGGDRVDRFFPMTNTARSSRVYELDGAEILRVEHAADDDGLAVIGVMHSHTHTTNYPSPTDVADAARFDPFGVWRFIIVSLKHPDPSLRCYRIAAEEITEEPVTVLTSGADA